VGTTEQVNVVMVDDHPAKLLSYEAILADLGLNLLRHSPSPVSLCSA